ncbi:MAG TPA: DUF2721 domain-containing protein [Candidatus Limnocylindria bacterium]|jgi:hypothetical protein|nr:DUF2721 domain-containing protein [Candidatus Limnocylindria bacterium]
MQRALTDIIPYLQTAIGPVILISGVGMLLLVMTNRFGRLVDRSRQLVNELTGAKAAEASLVREQVHILFLRARVLRCAIALASGSMLLAALLIVTIFVSALAGWHAGGPVVVQFIGSLLSLIGAIVAFLYDINLSLAAIRLELKDSGAL